MDPYTSDSQFWEDHLNDMKHWRYRWRIRWETLKLKVWGLYYR